MPTLANADSSEHEGDDFVDRALGRMLRRSNYYCDGNFEECADYYIAFGVLIGFCLLVIGIYKAAKCIRKFRMRDNIQYLKEESGVTEIIQRQATWYKEQCKNGSAPESKSPKPLQTAEPYPGNNFMPEFGEMAVTDNPNLNYDSTAPRW